MNFLLDYPSTDWFTDISVVASKAQLLLQQTGWAYYTIWKAVCNHNLSGLAWSTGGVNEFLVANVDNLNDGCRRMGLLLQSFYKQCSFLPSGSGSMAGETFASGKYRWATGGAELLMQIRLLNNRSQKPIPPKLQALLFKTVVCIPLKNGAGVLEIGTNELVPENEGLLAQMLKLVDGLNVCQGPWRGRQSIMISSAFEDGTKALEMDAGNPYGDLDEKYSRSASIVETYGSIASLPHPSTSSSLHWSPSSTTLSSTPSANDQRRGDLSSSTEILLPTADNEDKLMSPSNPLQAPSAVTCMVNNRDVLHTDFKYSDQQIDTQDGDDLPRFLLELDKYRFSSPNILAPTLLSPALPTLIPDSRQHAPPHSGGDGGISYHSGCMLYPIQGAYASVGNEQADAHHSLNEVVRGSSEDHSVLERQISTCDYQLRGASSVSSLPSLAPQFASHAASYTSSQQCQQWVCLGGKEGKGFTDLVGQSARHTTPGVGATNYYPSDYTRQEADSGREIMLEQDAGIGMIDYKGGTSKSSRSTTSSSGHEPFRNDKMSDSDEGKKWAISLNTAVPLTNQAAVNYISSHASGLDKHDKVVAQPSPSYQGTDLNYDSNTAEHYKSVSSLIRGSAGSHTSHASNTAGVYRVVDARTSQCASSYASYVSGSAEAGKVRQCGTSAVLAPPVIRAQGASSLLSSGSRDDRNRLQHGMGRGELLDLQVQPQGVKNIDQYVNESNFADVGFLWKSEVSDLAKSASPAQNEAAVQHMFAERDRRRKQGHYIDILRTRVPPITKKRPKVAILESTVQHLKELKHHICELEQEDAALTLLNQEDQERESTNESSNFVTNQRHVTDDERSLSTSSSQENAVCHYMDSCSADDRYPHFELSLSKNAQDVSIASATVIEILESLQAKNLCCYEIDYQFLESTGELSIRILANYKNGENHIPSLEEIQGIDEWWKHLSNS